MTYTLTISIVSWNTCGLLRECLRSLRHYCCPESTQLVVIDNASRDGTPAMIRQEFPEVVLVETGANLGFGKAHNLVRDIATAPFVLFLNPDTVFQSSAHEFMKDVLEKNADVGAVGCRLQNLDGSNQPLGLQCRVSPWSQMLTAVFVSNSTLPIISRIFPYHNPSLDGYVRHVFGGCIMVRRDVMEDIGWFDERFFMYAEDIDLCRRIEECGWKIYHLGSTVIQHVGGGASASVPGRFSTRMQCESVALFMEKYYGRRGRFLYKGIILCRSVFRLSVMNLLALSRVMLGRSSSASFSARRDKLRTMRSWSLGKAQPVIPS